MATIPLRTYFQHIDHFIEQKQFDEAIAHCKHILSHHPKSLETYRMMGKALLEKNRFGDAGDIFQRVLSSVPDDFISHVGMAIVREDEGNLEAALWHMERAFESNPANGPAQEELRRLYGRRDGAVPPRAQLTRGALARMYVKGELYPQAEMELRAALRDDPERLDLSLLLARVLLETGRRAEAADLAQTLLQKIPYGLEALRILSEILTQQNRADEARFYHQRLVALDPYEAYANGHNATTVGAEAVRVPELGEVEGQEAALALGSTPDWATSLGEKLETQPADSTDMPDWLKTGTGMLGGTGPLTGALTGAAALTGTDLPAAGEVPDWLKDVEPVQPTETAADMPDWMKATTGIATGHGKDSSEASSSITGWLATPQQPASPFDAPVAAQGDLPDWLKDIAPPTAPLGGVPAAAPTQPDALPDWLNASSEPAPPEWMTGPLGGDPTEKVRDTVPISEAPEWMKGATESLPGALPGETPDLPEWLKPASSATAGLTTPLDNTTPFTGEAPTESMPDWLKTSVEGDELPEWLKATDVGAGAQSEALPAPAQPEGLPAWMTNPAATQKDVPIASGDPSPDWMQSAAMPGAATQVEVPAASENLPAWMQSAETLRDLPVAEDLPDWLKPALSAVPSTAEQRSEAEREAAVPTNLLDSPPVKPAIDLPDFLQPASAEAIERANTPVEWEESETPVTAETSAEVPDWIKAMAPDLNSAPIIEPASEELPPIATEDLPDWLKPALSAVPSTAEQRSEVEGSVSGIAAAGLAAAALTSDSAPEPAPADVEAGVQISALPASAPDLASMSADDAMRWLEGLAANQGADADTLITKPEDRTDTPPAWVSDIGTDLGKDVLPDVGAGVQSFALSVPAQPAAAELPPWAQNTEPGESETIGGWLADKDVPDWLRDVQAETRAETAPPAEPLIPAEPALPDLDAMSADDAMRWLESLAAKQGADAETLITKPEDRSDTPPAWVADVGADLVSAPAQPEQPIAEATPAEDLPDWLKAVIAEEESAPTAPPTEPAIVASAPAQPDLANLSGDDAMRWLESLAANQGADADTLTTKPEDRSQTPPAWVTDIGADAQDEERPGPIMPPTGVLPDIFGVGDSATAASAAAMAEPIEIPAGEMSDDDAMRWLETLAAQQGAEADTLTTKPEDRLSIPPAWVADVGADVEAGVQSEALPVSAEDEEPAPQPLSGPPDWTKLAESEAAPIPTSEPEPAAPMVPSTTAEAGVQSETLPTPTPPNEPLRTGDKRLSQLATRLAAGRRAKEEDIAARFERERAEREQAQREVMEKMEQRRSRRTEAGTGALKPSTGILKTSTEVPTVRAVPPTESEVPSVAAAVEAGVQSEALPAPAQAALPQSVAPVAKRLTRARKRRAEFSAQAPADLLTASRQQLMSGQIEAASEGLGHLVNSGQHLNDIIAELEAYSASRGPAAPLSRLLGDAYMRAGKLQRALDAYRSALTQM